jgi:hypothetical protein
MTPDEMEPPLEQTRNARSIGPPPDLERRVVDTLRTRGLLHGGHPGGAAWRRRAFTTLAAASLLAVGFVLGTMRPAPAPPDGQEYLLLLYGNAGGLGASARDSVVAEYRSWAAELRDQGRMLLGEELDARMEIVPEGAGGSEEAAALAALGGFFVIRASDLAEAAEIARGTPHARRGGRVVVRPINPT